MTIMHSLDEIGLLPAVTSTVKSRKDVNPFYSNGNLPIFVAPMTCIVRNENYYKFEQNKFNAILPVSSVDNCYGKLFDDGRWIALTLNHFKMWFVDGRARKDVPYNILIDVANGHMQELYDGVREAKKGYAMLKVMIGNIANPATYIECCDAGVDYVRVGIGGGKGCLTSVMTGIHASLPYLLENINAYRKNHKDAVTKVIADGGIDTTDKIIKCLALGADYVMMGRPFASCDGVCKAVTVRKKVDPTTNDKTEEYYGLYYGQASVEGQFDRFGEVKSYPEGTSIEVLIDKDLASFEQEIEASLRSAMSYCGAKTLSDFIGKVQYTYMSYNEFTQYKK